MSTPTIEVESKFKKDADGNQFATGLLKHPAARFFGQELKETYSSSYEFYLTNSDDRVVARLSDFGIIEKFFGTQFDSEQFLLEATALAFNFSGIEYELPRVEYRVDKSSDELKKLDPNLIGWLKWNNHLEQAYETHTHFNGYLNAIRTKRKKARNTVWVNKDGSVKELRVSEGPKVKDEIRKFYAEEFSHTPIKKTVVIDGKCDTGDVKVTVVCKKGNSKVAKQFAEGLIEGSKILRSYSQFSDIPTAIPSVVYHYKNKAAVEYFKENHEQLTKLAELIDAISKRLGVSKKFITQYFKAARGETITEKVNQTMKYFQSKQEKYEPINKAIKDFSDFLARCIKLVSIDAEAIAEQIDKLSEVQDFLYQESCDALKELMKTFEEEMTEDCRIIFRDNENRPKKAMKHMLEVGEVLLTQSTGPIHAAYENWMNGFKVDFTVVNKVK